jgi:NADH-quinone oxidoreductase subunit N
VGLLLIFVGLAFKVAAVPFHMWAPDAYSGAPTLVTSFFAIAPKAAGFVALYRWVVVAGHLFGSELTVSLVSALAVLTILGGNLGALVQRELKRMLAYSSIAHAGYLLLALAAVGTGGTAALLFYLAAYGIMTLGAFVVLLVFERDGASGTYDEITGRAYTRPTLSLAMTVFMVSLAGLPGTVGFIGKFQIFKSLLLGGQLGQVLVAVAGTLISVVYYLRVVVYLYMRGEAGRPALSAPGQWFLVATSLAVGTVVLGLFPQLIWQAVAAWAEPNLSQVGWAGSP